MKKLSLSLVAILAFVLAISSAFTTSKTVKKEKSIPLEFQIWGIASNISCDPSTSTVLGATKVLLIDGSFEFDFDGAGGISPSSYFGQLSYAFANQEPEDTEHFSVFNLYYPDKNVSCAVNTTRACLVYYEDDGWDAVRAVICGVYSAEGE